MEALGSLIIFILTIGGLGWVFWQILKGVPFLPGSSKDEVQQGKSNLTNAGGAFAWLLKTGRNIMFPQFGLGGPSGRLLTKAEARRIFNPKHKGLLIDGVAQRLSPKDSFANCAVFATTGGGKTSGFILPNLLTLNDSMVVTDPSGELFAKTSGYLQRKGFDVQVINPADPLNSSRYNPLLLANTVAEINQVAQVLIENRFPDAKDPFWNVNAQSILALLIRILKVHRDGQYANLANLRHLVALMSNPKPLTDIIVESLDREEFERFKAFLSMPERTRENILSTAGAALSIVDDPDIAQLTVTNTLNFADLRKRKTVVFFCFPQAQRDYYAPVMTLFFSQMFKVLLDDRLYRQHKKPVYLLLDEFGHLKIPEFESIITTSRQRNVSISLILQDASQLARRYGKEAADTILNGGIATKVFFQLPDIKTAKELEEMVGYTRRQFEGPDGRKIYEDHPVLSATELANLPGDENKRQILVLTANNRPGILWSVPYYKRKDMVKVTKLPPATLEEIPAMSVDYLRP